MQTRSRVCIQKQSGRGTRNNVWTNFSIAFHGYDVCNLVTPGNVAYRSCKTKMIHLIIIIEKADL